MSKHSVRNSLEFDSLYTITFAIIACVQEGTNNLFATCYLISKTEQMRCDPYTNHKPCHYFVGHMRSKEVIYSKNAFSKLLIERVPKHPTILNTWTGFINHYCAVVLAVADTIQLGEI